MSEPVIVVFGLGYAGLPLALGCGEGPRAYGYDRAAAGIEVWRL